MPGTLVVGDLISRARSRHPTFDDRRHPDPVLLEALSDYQGDLVAEIITKDPSVLVNNFTQALPLAVFENGIAIPAYKYPFGVQATRTFGSNTKTYPIDLVNWGESAHYKHAAYLLNGILFLCGKSRDWEHEDSIIFLYVPEVADLATDTRDALTQVLTNLPDSARSTVIAFLAAEMASRGGAGPGQTPPDAASFAARWTLAEQKFLTEIGRKQTAVVGRVRDVF